jgi:hypothetical protein
MISVAVLALVLFGTVRVDAGSVTYGYDKAGRLTTVAYSNGVCIVYAYDKNGTRTLQAKIVSGTPQTPTWGAGAWRCFPWTP